MSCDHKDPPRFGPLQIEAWQQWSEWFVGEWNWQNFTVIEIAYEHDGGCGSYELNLALLGLCLRLTWFKKEPGPLLVIAKQRMEELMAERSSEGRDDHADLECDHDGEQKYVTADGYCLLCGEMVSPSAASPPQITPTGLSFLIAVSSASCAMVE